MVGMDGNCGGGGVESDEKKLDEEIFYVIDLTDSKLVKSYAGSNIPSKLIRSVEKQSEKIGHNFVVAKGKIWIQYPR